ncbi:MAG: hypothetical protein WC471_02990 [Candidatus Woesearchaeota archaeon]
MKELYLKEDNLPAKMEPAAAKLVTISGLLVNCLLLPGFGTIIGSIVPDNRNMRKSGMYNLSLVFLPIVLVMFAAVILPLYHSEVIRGWIWIFNAPDNLMATTAWAFAFYCFACIYAIFVYFWGVYDSIRQIIRVFFKK